MKRKQKDEARSTRIWGVRAGKGGNAHDLFLKDGVIALADAELGDLTKLPKSREDFCVAYRKTHPEETKMVSAGIAGKFFRFVHEISVGDLVVYPALLDKMIYVGSVSGNYVFDETSPFEHKRSVAWKFMIPKNNFSIAAQYELGAARTFFEFKRNANELLAKMESKAVARLRSDAKVR